MWWCWRGGAGGPPEAVEDHPDTVDNVVTRYNVTYVGIGRFPRGAGLAAPVAARFH